MKKNIRKTAILLIVAMLLCSVALSACSAEKAVYSDSVLQTSVETAAKERVKTEISNKYKTYKVAKEAEDLVVESISNDGYDWFANGTVTATNRTDDADVQTVDFSISLHLIDYVGQPTPTFEQIEFTMGEIVAP